MIPIESVNVLKRMRRAVAATAAGAHTRRELGRRFGMGDALLEEIACPVCPPKTPQRVHCQLATRDSSFLPLRLSFTYMECENCGLVYVSPRLKTEVLKYLYSRAYAADPASTMSTENVLKKGRDAESYVQHARQVAPPAEYPHLLDIGCGHGFFLIAALAAGYEARGQEFGDYSEVWQSWLPPGTADRITVAALSRTDRFPTESHDLVTLWEVAEHVQDPLHTFRQAARVLRAGGYLFLESPRADSVPMRLLGRRWTQVIPEDHLFLWTEQSMERLLTQTGFEVIEVRDSVSPRDAFVGRIHVVARKGGGRARS